MEGAIQVERVEVCCAQNKFQSGTQLPAQVTEWLDSFDSEPDSANPMTEEAGHFMYMLAALEESGLWPD